jgi:hypothetical protein
LEEVIEVFEEVVPHVEEDDLALEDMDIIV